MDHHLVVTFHYQQQEVFAKIVKFYSRHIPRQLQRLIEFVVLCAAISSLCLLIYAHAVVKHLPKRCVDGNIAQNPRLLAEYDILRVDFARDVPLNYGLNDSYAKEFSFYGFYNALFDNDGSENQKTNEASSFGNSEDEYDEDEFDDAGSESEEASSSATDPEQQDTAENTEAQASGYRPGKRRIRSRSDHLASTHFDEWHPTDSLFANLCSSLYLMVTGGLARAQPISRTRSRSPHQSKNPNSANEPAAAANFIRQLARHFPPAAFAVVSSDALFASANADRFVVEFSRELGFLKLTADVRSRLGLQTALWYFTESKSPEETPAVRFKPAPDLDSSFVGQPNTSTSQCEIDSFPPKSSLKPKISLGDADQLYKQPDGGAFRFDSAVCFGSQFDRFLFDYAFGYDDYLIGIVKRYTELLNVTHGYVRNVINGEYYRYRIGGMVRGGLRGTTRLETVLRSAIAMCGFTWLVSTLLRHSHEQIFALIVALLRHLETNWTLVLPASPLFVIVLGLLGAQVLLATVFRTESPTAFFLLVAVWFADHFYALVSTGAPPHARTARVYFARFFYAYQFAFYIHYALEAGLFAGLALVTYALFLLHAAVYLFHHHHLPLARAARAHARRLRRSDRHLRASPGPAEADADAEAEAEAEADADADAPAPPSNASADADSAADAENGGDAADMR